MIASTFSPGRTSLKAIFACIDKALKFPLDNTIPLGFPVVPPLCNMTAGVSLPVAISPVSR